MAEARSSAHDRTGFLRVPQAMPVAACALGAFYCFWRAWKLREQRIDPIQREVVMRAFATGNIVIAERQPDGTVRIREFAMDEEPEDDGAP